MDDAQPTIVIKHVALQIELPRGELRDVVLETGNQMAWIIGGMLAVSFLVGKALDFAMNLRLQRSLNGNGNGNGNSYSHANKPRIVTD